MHACIHTYIHTNVHAHIQTYIHTHIHTYIHACMHTCKHTCLHTCIHACIHLSHSRARPSAISSHRKHTHIRSPPPARLAPAMPAVCARRPHRAQRWARRAAIRAGSLVARAAAPGRGCVCEFAAAPPTRPPTYAGGTAPACPAAGPPAPMRAGVPMRAGGGHHCGLHLVGLCALCDIAIVGQAAGTQLRGSVLDGAGMAASTRVRLARVVRRCAAVRRPTAAAIVRRNRVRRFPDQLLPAGLLEDPRGGVRRCGHRPRQAVLWHCDVRCLAERLRHRRRRRRLQRPPEGRIQKWIQAAVRRYTRRLDR
jgi:hypothetical protein